MYKNYVASIQVAENNKFVEIANDPRFPSISVVRNYPSGATDLQTFPKTAELVYVVNNPNGNSAGWDVTQAVVNGSASYVRFPSNSGVMAATVYNQTGTTLDIMKNGGTFAYPLPTGSSLVVPVTGNTDEIRVRRTDLAGTPVSAYCLFTY